jgi:hypothetical protein
LFLLLFLIYQDNDHSLYGQEVIRGAMHILISGFLVRAALWIWMQLPIPWRLIVRNLDNDLHGFWI